MAANEPWITFKRDYELSFKIVSDPGKELYAIRIGNTLIGFTLIDFKGALVGYIQAVCVNAKFAGKGFGSKLMNFAENRIFEEQPNVFFKVSSFNKRAQTWYEALGYECIGIIKDCYVKGHNELIFRKTQGPISEFKK